MKRHTIRLRGPWELSWTADGRGTVSKVRLPASWHDLFGPAPGRIRLSRRFHKPTNLHPGQEVSLVFHDLPANATVCVNGQTVIEPRAERAGCQRTAIDAILQPNNLLTIEFDLQPPSGEESCGELWGEVAIEIGPQ